MNVSIDSKNGKTLLTQGKYCAENIVVTPVLEEATVTPSTSAQSVTPSDGKAGLSKVTVGAIETEEKTVTSNGEVTPTSGKYLSKVTVNVPSTPTQEKAVTITENGTTEVTPDSGKALSKVTVVTNVPAKTEEKTITVTENGTTTVTPSSGKDGLSKVTVTTNVPSQKPTLIAPILSLSGSQLTIDDPNGDWANEWKISNGETVSVVGVTSANLAQIFANSAISNYSITAKAINVPSGAMNESDSSNSVSWSIYAINYTLTHCTATTKPTKAYQGAGISITLKADTNFALPSSITVTGATVGSYNSSTGAVVLRNPTGTVTVECVATQSVFSITANLTGCKADSTNPTTINKGGTASLIFTANDGYQLPASVTVSGATHTWAQATGRLNLSNPTANVTITITATATTPTEDELAGTWTFNETLNLSAELMPKEVIVELGWVDLPITADDGTEYFGLLFGSLNEELNEFTSLLYGETEVYNGVWNKESDRIITINALLEEVKNGQSLLEFMQANATKDGVSTRISFTVDGVEYYALPGMTWEEFANNGDYDPGVFFSYNNMIVTSDYSTVQYNGVNVTPADIIQSNANYTLAPAATLISFTIDRSSIGSDTISYQAEEGMTWAQWVESSYNTGGYMDAGTKISDQKGNSVAIRSGKFTTDVSPSDTIQASTVYVLKASTGGGGK